MSANIFTKNEILQNLASKGYFIDGYTLDGFFKKWKIEAIFEDEKGNEFFDNKTLDFVVNNFFNGNNVQAQAPQPQTQQIQQQNEYNLHIAQDYQNRGQTYNQQPPQQVFQQAPQQIAQPYQAIVQPQNQNAQLDYETNQVLNNISLSDGTPLAQRMQNNAIEDYMKIDIADEPMLEIHSPNENYEQEAPKERKMGILEGAMLASGQEYEPEITMTPIVNPMNQANDDDDDFDDMSLLSESYEAQEKFREYVVSELSKKNMDLTPTSGEIKLDVPEQALMSIAKSIAKKITQQVNQIYSSDVKNSSKITNIQEQNKKMEQRIKELEEQNKKLKLLLIESNKNLNSYKPSILGLYKKLPPSNN